MLIEKVTDNMILDSGREEYMWLTPISLLRIHSWPHGFGTKTLLLLFAIVYHYCIFFPVCHFMQLFPFSLLVVEHLNCKLIVRCWIIVLLL